jgi:CRP-like cAMP-binding protein
MPLSWIKRPKQRVSVDELVADGKFDKAIAVLRKQFSRRYPSTTERQRYAEVLVLAGRGAEAVPVLLGVADEQERYGFPGQARETLQRAAEIEPDQAEVKERLEAVRDTPTPSPAADEGTPAPAAIESPVVGFDAAFGTEPESPADDTPVAVDAPASPSGDPPDFVALDADEPEPASLGREPGPTGAVVSEVNPSEVAGASTATASEVPAAAEATVTVDGQELVVVDDIEEKTAPSLRVEGLSSEEEELTDEAQDEGEITARSLQVDPSVLGEEDLEPVAEDPGEKTAPSLHVDPSFVGPSHSAASAEDPGEKTAPSLRLDPSMVEEETAPSAGPTLPLPEQDPGFEQERVESTGAAPGSVDSVAAAPASVDSVGTAPAEPAPPAPEESEASSPGTPPQDCVPGQGSRPKAGAVPESIDTAGAEPGPAVTFADPRADDARPEGDAAPEEEALQPVDAGPIDSVPAAPAAEPEPPEPASDPVAMAPDEDLAPEEVDELIAGDGPELGAGPALDPTAEEELRSLLTDEDLEAALTADAEALLSDGPTADEPGPLEDDGHLHELLTTDARALLSDHPKSDEPPPPGSEGPFDELQATDARALLANGPTRDGGEPEESAAASSPDETHLFLSEDDLLGALTGEAEPSLHETSHQEERSLVQALAAGGGVGGPTLGATLFADLSSDVLGPALEGMRRRACPGGDTVIREGESGHSLFLIASGTVRILVTAPHGPPLEIRRIGAHDFFGEVAALSDKPRSATVVAATPCELLEVDRDALEALLARRPAARALLDEAWARRALSPEETAVRSLPPEAADPLRAAEALRDRYGRHDWSARVRLHLAGVMLETERAGDALMTLAGVAEDLVQRGHGRGAMTVLKKADRLRHRRPGEAASETDLQEGVQALLSEAEKLAAGPTPSVEEQAEGNGQEQGQQLAG